MYKLLPGKDFVRIIIIRTTGIVIRQMKKTVLRSSSEEWRTLGNLASLCVASGVL
jgi:hypothetical protein